MPDNKWFLELKPTMRVVTSKSELLKLNNLNASQRDIVFNRGTNKYFTLKLKRWYEIIGLVHLLASYQDFNYN